MNNFDSDNSILGWKASLLISIFSGFILSLTQPLVIESYSNLPIDPDGYLGWLGFVAYVPILLIIKEKNNIQVFMLVFLASFVQFFIIFHWIIITIAKFADISLIFSIIICSLLSCLSSLYVAIAFVIANYLFLKLSFKPWILNPLALCSATYISNYGLFGGFSWGHIGYSLANISIFLQGASLVGVYGLVLFVMLVNAAFAEIIWTKVKKIKFPKIPVFIAIMLIIFFSIFGLYRLADNNHLTAKYVKIGLLQGNIKQGIKNKQRFYYDYVIDKYQNLQKLAINDGAEIILWPEVAFPLIIEKNIKCFKKFKNKTPTLIIGATAVKKINNKFIYYNSAIIVAPEKNMRVIGWRDKTHLVPFGEYIPWPFKAIADKFVPNIVSITPAIDFGPINILLPNGEKLMIGITICYEGIFPEIFRNLANNGAKIIFNLTNDAWYGVSSAPYQHLNMYKFRAVETGRNLARVTNTGISAFIDYNGFVYASTSLYVETVITRNISLANDNTIYLIVGDIVPILSIIFLIASLIFALFKYKICVKNSIFQGKANLRKI